MSLPRFSVSQPVLVNVLFFVCLLGGLAAWSRIPVEFFQDINLNEAQIRTIWLGASAEEVERLVTRKLEEELIGIADIDEMRSVSSAGLSDISIDFDEELDEVAYEAALNDVRAAIDRVEDLPPDAEEPILEEGKFSEFAPAVMVAVVDSGGVGPLALREVARDVETRVKRLPGANRVEIRAERDREVRVLVDRDAAARFGLTVVEVAERIRRQNLNLPAGTFEAGDGERTVRAQGDYQSPEEILSTVVAENPNGTFVRLGEVARLEEALEKARFRTRYNGQPALLVSITKKSEADVIRLVEAVDAWIERYRPLLPDGVVVAKTFDTAAFVSSRMSILAENLVAGVLCVMAILWFTIGFRNAALTVIAIPFSFLTAMIFFPLFGITINATTIIGMLLVSGMLVDDAIIVLENIYARVERGEPLREAVVHGAEEVLWPVVAAVATTCAAFLPLLLVGGVAGRFVEILPKAVVVCLLASLFECLLILPAHYLDFGSRRRADGAAAGRVARARATVDRGVAALRDQYARALDLVLAHRLPFTALFGAVFLLAFAGAQHLRVDLFPGEFDTFNVLFEGPSDSSLDRSDRVAQGYETVIAPFVGDDLRDVATTVGMSVDTNYDRLIGTNYAMSVLTLEASEENTASPERALFQMQERVEAWRAEQPGRVGELRVQAEQDGPPVGPPVEVRLQGDDYQLGKSVAGEMRAFLETIPGVYNVEDNLKAGTPEMRLLVDDERAARHGLGFEDLARALRGANDGLIASSLRDPLRNEDVDIRVRLEDRYRRDFHDLLDVEVRTPAGYLVKLRDVADVEVTRGFRAYHRYDGKRTVSVFAQVDDERATSLTANQKLRAAFADLPGQHPELEVRYGGEYEESGEAFADLFRAFPVALVAMYMILAALFRSYLQPFIVVSAVPFAFVGIILGVAALDYSVSFVLLYAAVGLTGVVVNDSLVMVAFINQARREGADLLDAVRQSGARRFRPILLTTLTTVVALLPMALGLQGASKTYGPFAASIAFGLIVAMVGTLFAVPLAYTTLIVWQRWLARAWRRRSIRPAPDAAPRPRTAA
ncbi:MAG: efflux RND transporter permease subunit [Myxococcota bacterium]|nr:efflux RND transporter permease subunit [Myxococcota bacterium]